MTHKRALVLNADFRPLGVIGWQRAIVLTLENQETPGTGLEVVTYYADTIKGTAGKEYPAPAVVRSPNYIKQKKRNIPFSRKNVFIRDQLKCQYCGERFKPSELTYDHVVPRAKWKKQKHVISPTQWNNIVTACIPCNRIKANRTPKEANMKLIKEPQEPNPYGYILGLTPWGVIPEEWYMWLTSLYSHLKDVKT